VNAAEIMFAKQVDNLE